jgi:hypothetical protein
MLSVTAAASSGSSSLDAWSLAVAIAAAVISLATLAFTVGNEWWRGRRIRVTVNESTIGNSPVYAVTAKNKGNISVYVIDWGYVYTTGRGPGRDRRFFKPGNTGIHGPQLPGPLSGGEQILLNAAADIVKDAANKEPPMKRMRAYIEIASSRRLRHSAAINLP